MTSFRYWLIRQLGGTVKTCNHKWRILIQRYPTYAWDKWQCVRCNTCKDFPNNAPPEPLRTEICNLGDVHIVNGLGGR